MNNYTFRRGFIFASRTQRLANPEMFSGWNRLLTAKYKMFMHPDANVRLVRSRSGREAIVVGDVFVAHGGTGLDELLTRLADGEHAVLDALSGRFAAFLVDGEEARVVHDPLGSQSIFYRLGAETVVASHASLLAECCGFSRSSALVRYMATPEYRSRRTRFLPGDLTLYDEVVHLIPNNELGMHSGWTRRYWPHTPFASRTFEDVLTVWDEYFARYAQHVVNSHDPVIGLTGGLDSRTVIATLIAHGATPRFVTWDQMGEEEAARIPALAAHLPERHEWIKMSEEPRHADAEAIRDGAQKAAGYTRGRSKLPALMAEGAGASDVFVKGLGGEVMRGSFNSRMKSHLPADPVQLTYALYAGSARIRAGKEYASITTRAVQNFLRRANYGAKLHGADVGDLVYWEQWMGTWTAVQHAELASAMNSHSAMNSRKIFEAAWGLSDDERFGDQLLLRIMKHYDPVLASL